MSVYETSITNPKKQLEFYKDLSEQLEKDNQELKKQLKYLHGEKFYEIMEDYFTKCSYNQKYKEVIDRAIEYISEVDDNTDDTTCYDIDKYTRDYILSILKGVE